MRIVFAGLLLAPCIALAAFGQSFVNFESPQTRPIAVSPDGKRLFAVNTADNRLAVYSLSDPSSPILLREVEVGLEPVSVTARTNDEVWVVNRLSDSVSVVSVSKGFVTDTIQAKDEPGDVAFAGSRAFVSVSTDREVRVFDVTTHQLVGTIQIFGDTPRTLLASADGKTVWVAVHRSGNGTTIVPAGDAPPPPAPTNQNLPPAPPQGIIVKADDPSWRKLKVTLPDHDVVEVDAATLSVRRSYSAVGTLLFNLALRPGTGELWVANTEALNRVRFEPNLRGHAVDNRVTRIVTGATPVVTPIDLNPTVNYKVLPSTQALSAALAQPTDLVFSPDGSRLYVAAFGTDRIGVLDPAGKTLARIEVGNTPGATTDPRNKRGPRGLAHHPTAPHLYVLNRLSSSISVVGTTTNTVQREIPMVFDPTPKIVREGRGFLYDAKLSGNGTFSCASCHVDGSFDGVAWDLGDPGGVLKVVQSGGLTFTFHPMKGPMTTQTLRGLAQTAPHHWRGDRKDLSAFNPAFADLMGKQPLAKEDMDDYATFMHSLAFPPNPNQNPDRTLPTTPAGESAQDGFNYYTTVVFNRIFRCVDCHSLGTGTNTLIIPSRLLTGPQDFKVPQLRNIYKRTGRKPRTQGRVSGFGLLHDGSEDSVFTLLGHSPFGRLARQTENKRMLERFVEAFDTGMAPAVGRSFTVTQQNVDTAAVTATVQFLTGQAKAGNCDLVAKGVLDQASIGFQYDVASSKFLPDRKSGSAMTVTDLKTAIRNGRATVTLMGVPPGSGKRIGRDRDSDAVLDGDEGLEPYGAPSPACAASLRLTGNSPPTLGNTGFALVTWGAPANTTGFVFLGTAPALVPILDMKLLVSIATLFPVATDGAGVGVLPLPIPNVASLKGQVFYFQAAYAHPCSSHGLAATGGLKVTIDP